MKIRDLKIATLKLIEQDGEQILPSNIPNLEDDDNYSVYLQPFNESLNRCLQEIVKAKKLPLQSVEITLDEDVKEYDLSSNIDNLYEVCLIQIYDADGNKLDNISYLLIGNILELSQGIEGKLKVYYFKTLAIQTTFDDDLELSSLGLNSYLESIIPYYIKGEVYESEEPNKAVYSMNRFIDLLDSAKAPTITSNSTTIKRVKIW